jgi:hypothetical protein
MILSIYCLSKLSHDKGTKLWRIFPTSFNTLDKWLNLLEGYFFVHNFFGREKITFALLKDLPMSNIGGKPHQWHTLLAYTLWAYHTTTKKKGICHTPFQLLYGQNVVMHVELELTSLRLVFQFEELNLIDIP